MLRVFASPRFVWKGAINPGWPDHWPITRHVCHVSGENITIDQFDQEVLNKDISGNVHFGINWNSAANNCCATSLCTEMIFLRDKEKADKWLSEDRENREIFNIDEAIEFASCFFRPLVS